jgi:tRNA wybutosine-synthesizing protein 2
MKFKKQLKEKLTMNLTEEELSLLPGGFQTIGDVIIIRLNPLLLKKRTIIAEKCLELYPNLRAVYLNLGIIKGQYRTPENIEFIAGEDNTIVEHKEHGVTYKFDIKKIMFSKGNINERKYLASLVKSGEIIVDMFAGIGYFSLPIARNAAPFRIYSIEINPVSYDFLVQNIKVNQFEDIIIPINGDSKIEVPKLAQSGVKADRVIMGVFPAPRDYIAEALTVVKDEGTIYHYEGVEEKGTYMRLFEEFDGVAKNNNYNCELLDKRFVKSYGPALYHLVIDILVSKVH